MVSKVIKQWETRSFLLMKAITTPRVGKGVAMKMAIAYLVCDLQVYVVFFGNEFGKYVSISLLVITLT